MDFLNFLALNDEATLTLRGLDVNMLFSLVSRRSLFSQEQAQVNKRLKELQRRHNEFRRLLLGGQGPFSAGPAFLTSSQAPFVFLGSEGQFGNNPVSVLYTSSLWLDSFFCLNDSKLSIKRLNQHFFETLKELQKACGTVAVASDCCPVLPIIIMACLSALSEAAVAREVVRVHYRYIRVDEHICDWMKSAMSGQCSKALCQFTLTGHRECTGRLLTHCDENAHINSTLCFSGSWWILGFTLKLQTEYLMKSLVLVLLKHTAVCTLRTHRIGIVGASAVFS